MKKIGRHHERLGRAILFREDVEEIARIMQTTQVVGNENEYPSDYNTVQIKALGYQLTLAEVGTLPAKRAEDIQFDLRGMSLSLNKSCADANVDDEAAQRGALAQIRSHLDDHCRPPWLIRNVVAYCFWVLSVCLGILLATYYAVAHVFGTLWSSYYGAIMPLLAIPLAPLLMSHWRHSHIHILPRHAHKTWLTTNRDQVLVNVVCGVILMIVGAFLERVIRPVKPLDCKVDCPASPAAMRH